MRLIWAYNDMDPADGDLSLVNYHGLNRGSRSIQLLNPVMQQPELPDDIVSFDMVFDNVSK